MPTCVSIQSLWENKNPDDEYNVFVIGLDLSDISINKILSINLDKFNLKLLQFKDKYKSLYENKNSHISTATLFKFDIPNILKDLNKILYIDCDTIIAKNGIDELYNTDISDVYAGVVKDVVEMHEKYHEKLGLSSYFNAGIMLMNLDLMRKDKITEKLIDYKAKYPNDLFVDQDTLNKVLNEKVRYLPYKYNYLTITDKPVYYNSYIYDEKSNPVIIHFVSPKKPWNNNTVNYTDKWDKYYKKSVFKDCKLKRKRKFIYKQKYGNIKVFNIFGLKIKFKMIKNNPLFYKEIVTREKLVSKEIYHVGKLKLTLNKKKSDALFNYLKNEKYAPFGYEVTKSDNNTFEISGNGLLLQSKLENMIWISEEVLCGKVYDFSITDPFIMIDIGVNYGVTSLHFALNDNIKHIYGFEPFPLTYEMAENNLKLNPELSKKIDFYNFGLGDCDKKFKIPYDESFISMMSTVYSNEISKHKKLPLIDVEIKNAYNVLKEIIDKHNEKVFVKLDAEGAEFEILPLLSEKGLLQKIDVVVMEYHKKSPETIFEILSKNGFVYFHNTSKETGLIRAYRISDNR